MKKTLFLILSGAIVIFSIICICSGPIINGVIPKALSWRTENCQQKSDYYKDAKDKNLDKETIDTRKKARNKCNREKAMYGLEYSSLIIDVICGFVCTILGLLHYFDIGKPFEKVTGIIGLSTGIIGFILTLFYVIYSGYIFTKDPYVDEDDDPLIKRDGDWAFAKYEDGKGYKCLFYKEKDKYSTLAKYSDLGKKQYNYNKKKSQDYSDTNSDLYKCSHYTVTENGNSQTYHFSAYSCQNSEYYFTSRHGTCDYLYANPEDDYVYKYLFDRWITTIIFSCLIIVCDIGLAIFGFLLFKSDGSGI